MFYIKDYHSNESYAMSVAQHAFGGIIVVTMMFSTYYSIMPFIIDSQQPIAPASIFAWCMLLPMTLGVLYLWNVNMLKDRNIGEKAKLVFLIFELAVALAVMSFSAKNDVFACGILACTYDVLPPVQHEDQLVQTWDPPSSEAVTAMMYFTLSIALLPFILWQIRIQYTSISSTPDAEAEQRESEVMSSQRNPMFDKTRRIEMVSVDHIPAASSPSIPARESSITALDSTGKAAADYLKIALHRQYLENRRWWQWTSALVCLLILWPFHYFCTARLGNDFQWFSNYGIAAWAKHVIEPAIPQITINKLLNYKFFPQIIIFYVWIYGIVATALIAKVMPSVRKFFNSRPLVFQHLAILNRCTMGEFLFAFFFAVFQFATFAYTFWNWYSIPHIKWRGSVDTERWGRCLGQTSMFAMGAMVLPISRNSVWARLLDYPWDGMIKFHKWMSIVFILISSGHMIAFWFCFHSLNEFPAAIFSSPNVYRKEDSTIGMMSGLIFFILIPVFCILTWNHIRRKQFELFYYTHLFSTVIFLATLWHADFAWMYMIPGLTMWLVDHCLRFTDNVKNYEITGLEACGDDVVALSLVVKKTPKTSAPVVFESGQYIFLNIPDISPLQSHPFNISGSMYDSTTTIHIKSCGRGTWTGKLLELAKKAGKQNDSGKAFPLKHLGITVDGPYGLPIPYTRCRSILLIGGGIGVTPLHSIFRSLLHLTKSTHNLPDGCQLRKVKLVWAFRNEDLVFKNSMFRDTLSLLHTSVLKDADTRGKAPSSTETTPKASHTAPAKSKALGEPAEAVGTPQHVDGDEVKSPEDVSKFATPSSSPTSKSAAQNVAVTASTPSGDEGDIKKGTEVKGFKSSIPGKKGTPRPRRGSAAYKEAKSSVSVKIKNVLFEVSLFCTKSKNEKPTPAKISIDEENGLSFPLAHSRPDLVHEVSQISGNQAALCLCVGPDTLVVKCREVCSDLGVEFRGEDAEL